jgi:hypothetical protein
LIGLKENVIIGKLIPAGTGFIHGRFTDAVEEAEEADVEVDTDVDAEELPDTEAGD